MTNSLWMFSVVLASTCCGVEPIVTDKPPEPYIVHRAAQAPKIDGNLNEPAWERASAITKFNLFSRVDVDQLPTTTARILWDKTHLYLGFECDDDDIWSYSEKNDDPLYLGDVVELFVKPNRDSLKYYEFVVAPNGAIYDARYPSRGAGLSHRFGRWNSEAKIATQVKGSNDNHSDSDHGYSVEIAIPLEAFESQERPSEGTEWSFGVFRYDYSKSYEDCLMLMSIPKASASHGFHHYEAYGPLRFAD
jgi:hypothetical protein